MVDMENINSASSNQIENDVNQSEIPVDIDSNQTGNNNNQENENKKNKFPGFNLYVKNLDDSFTDSTLREAFKEFGIITSAKVMSDASGHSKGFGFVCFTGKEEADKALTAMNGRIVGSKPLYVAMAQKKEERKQYLNDKYKNFNLNSSVPFVPPVTVASSPQPSVPPRMPDTSPHIQYIPNNTNNVMHAPVQYRYVSNEMPWTSPATYIMPPGHMNRPVTYMPYQPVLLVPGVNMVAPPQQMPILHQPIYIHSSKTNTLIYSTSVQTAPPPVTSPANFPPTPSGTEIGGMVIPKAPQDIIPPQTKNNGNNVTMNDHQHIAAINNNNNIDPVQQLNKEVLMSNPAPDQMPANSNFQFMSHSNNNFTT